MNNSVESMETSAAPAIRTGRGCRFCSGPSLRRSRLRPADVPRVLMLHWPVRCLRCHKRQFVLWQHARQAISSNTPHAPELREKESWQNFTSGEPPQLRSTPRNEDKR